MDFLHGECLHTKLQMLTTGVFAIMTLFRSPQGCVHRYFLNYSQDQKEKILALRQKRQFVVLTNAFVPENLKHFSLLLPYRQALNK